MSATCSAERKVVSNASIFRDHGAPVALALREQEAAASGSSPVAATQAVLENNWRRASRGPGTHHCVKVRNAAQCHP